MGEPRELILKLGQKITDRIGVKVTVNDPEYWGLAGVVTDEMAEVALAMKVRVPDTAENIAKKCGTSITGRMPTDISSIFFLCLFRAVRSSW